MVTGSPSAVSPSQRVRLSLRPIAIFLVSRLVVALGVLIATIVVHRPWQRILTSWDSHWYLSIARSGYVAKLPAGTGNAAQSNLGFFPLLPLVIRTVHELTHLDYPTAGLLASLVTGLCASVVLWWLLRSRFPGSAADRGTCLVLFWPGAFILSYVYTEGLVIALVAGALLALHHRRWVLAGVCAGIATAADPVASAVIVPCVIAAVSAIRARREWASIIAPLLAPAGIVAFFSYLWVHTGTPLEWFHAQRKGWQSGYYGMGVPQAVGSFVVHGVSNWNPGVKVACALLVIALVVAFVKAKPPSTWAGYVYAVLVFGIVSPIIGITPRLMLRAFPLEGTVGAWLSRPWFGVAITLSALGMVALTIMASTPHWTP